VTIGPKLTNVSALVMQSHAP